MKNYFFASWLSLLLLSCETLTIRINLDEFNGSYEKAFASQFEIRDDKIYLNDAFSTFDGRLSIVGFDKSVKEMTIDDGEIEAFAMHDMINRVMAEGKRKGSDFRISFKPRTFDSTFNNTEYALTHFSNKAFIARPLAEQEGSTTSTGNKGIEATGKVNINHQKNLIIIETLTKKHGVLLAKTVSYLKYLPDSTRIEVAFREYSDIEDYSDVGIFFHKYADVYAESVSISGPKGSMNIKISWSDEGDLRVVSEQDNYNSKNCSFSEVLVSGVSPLSIGQTYCVNDGLIVMNELLKKQITRETLIARFLAKRINNRFLTQQSSDVDFYF
jgi:hypothetical protein